MMYQNGKPLLDALDPMEGPLVLPGEEVKHHGHGQVRVGQLKQQSAYDTKSGV